MLPQVKYTIPTSTITGLLTVVQYSLEAQPMVETSHYPTSQTIVLIKTVVLLTGTQATAELKTHYSRAMKLSLVVQSMLVPAVRTVI